MKLRILIIGLQLGFHQLTLSDELPQLTSELLKFRDTNSLFHGTEKDVSAIVLDRNYYDTIPHGISRAECPTGEDAGVIAYRKLQPLYPSTTFFMFGLKGSRILSGQPHLVPMGSALLDVPPSKLAGIVAKGLKVRRAKSASAVT